MKTCKRCGVKQPLSNFYLKKQSYYNSYCKECDKQVSKESKSKNPNKYKSLKKTWSEKNPDYMKDYNLKKNYGISKEQYDEMLTNQNNSCAICNISFEKVRACVDHNHTTGLVRSILCSPCNTSLGLLKENKDIIKEALNYLEKHN